MGHINYSLFGIPWRGSARTAVFGVAYDSTSELAKGAAAFPAAVRLASYSIEWPGERDAADFGDLVPPIPPAAMVGSVKEFMGGLWDDGFRRFLVLGGNHSVTVPVVQFLAENGLESYVQFDAHADYRPEFMGTPYSFACTLRRVAEVVPDVSLVGVRSVAPDEEDVFDDVTVITGEEAGGRKEEVAELVRRAGYVSIDMDVFNVPGVTNPQPQHALELGYVLDVLQGAKASVDLVEGVPEKLYGDLAGSYGALLAREVIKRR